MTRAQHEKQLEVVKAELKKATSSKENARAFLRKAGIIDKNNQFTKPYR
jgi:hypothetical protein